MQTARAERSRGIGSASGKGAWTEDLAWKFSPQLKWSVPISLTIAAGTPGFRADAERRPGRCRSRDGSRRGGARSWWSPGAATMAATALSPPPNWPRAAARSPSSCCASGTACRATRRSAARGWKYPVLPFNPQAIGRPALIIDALFGAGLNRPVKGEPHEMIEAINANGAPVLSRRPAERHQRRPPAPSWASRSAPPRPSRSSARKPAHLLLPGRMHCGRVRLADIGIDAARARGNPAADFRERSAGLAQLVSGAADRRP